MSQITLKNEKLTAVFSSTGAELHSLKTSDGKEYIHRDMSVWEFSAPMLFPICGGLKDDKFIHGGKEYFLPKHGFIRTAEFDVESTNETSVVFLYTDNDETRKVYPFSFELRLIYELSPSKLDVRYSITNKSNEDMHFSVGCHEAYLTPGGIDGYKIVFDEKETLDTHKLCGNLLEYETSNVITDSDTLMLNYEYFSVDALVFSKFKSSGVNLVALDGTREIRVEFPEFSHLLFWTKAEAYAPYICIEPWCGSPDMVDSVYDLAKRPGILCAAPGETKNIDHSITVIK